MSCSIPLKDNLELKQCIFVGKLQSLYWLKYMTKFGSSYLELLIYVHSIKNGFERNICKLNIRFMWLRAFRAGKVKLCSLLLGVDHAL